MVKIYFKNFLVAFFLSISCAIFSQSVGINTTGTNPSPNAILDLNTGNKYNLGLIIPHVILGASVNTFSPPMAYPVTAKDTGMMVYNVNGPQPVGYYCWNGSSWVTFSGGAPAWNMNGNAGTSPGTNYAGTSDAKDFVIKTSGSERTRFMAGGTAGIGTSTPKSTVDVNGSMSIGAYAGITAAPSNGMIVSGQVAVGNNAPVPSTVVDFTNTMALGGTGAAFRWPSNPNPAANIAAPVLGDEIYNSTTGCFNFYNGSAWLGMGCPCNTPPPIPTITASCPFSLQGTTITYSSSVINGVTFSWTVTASTGTPTVTGNGTSSITVTWPSGGAGSGVVTLVLTNLCGTTTTTKAVTIYANPTMSGPTSINVLSAGNTYAVTSIPGATYLWSFVTNTDGSTIVGPLTNSSISVTAGNSPGTFTLQCIVSFGACSYTVTYSTITVSCPATPTMSGPTSLIVLSAGNTYAVTPIAGATYLWSFVTNTDGSTIVGPLTGSSISVTAGSSAGTFTLQCVVTFGSCIYTVTYSTITVSCPATPTISGVSSIDTSSVGNVYTCSLAGATYAWSFITNTDGSIITSATNLQNVTVKAGATVGSFTLQCIVTYGSCNYTITYGVTVISCLHGTITFSYTGSAQTWVIPACISQVTIDIAGAQGGSVSNLSVAPTTAAGGLGGRVTATVPVTGGTTLQINVGGVGLSDAATLSCMVSTGGYVGGGTGYGGYNSYNYNAGGGGGESDIRVPPYAYANVLAVGGGGGGAACTGCTGGGVVGGPGGGLTGGNGGGGGCNAGADYGHGGTQVGGGAGGTYWGAAVAGTQGAGGNSLSSGPVTCGGGGGGGAGYYGGGGGSLGGGGSNYVIGSAVGVTHYQGYQSGNGYITINY